MFQRSLNLSNRTFKIDAKILDLFRRFKAELVKVSARSVTQSVVGPFNEPSKLYVYLTKENISKLNGVVLSPHSHIRLK